jgi:hypothetical protein
MAKIHHFNGFSISEGDIRINVDLDRLSDQFNEAQLKLDSMVMASMVRFMPFQDGTFINETKAQSAAMAGTGVVCAGVPPQGRFLYEGKVMVGERTRSAWAEQGEKKVVTNKNLTYSNGRQSHWFEAAEKADKKKWIRATKKIAGGG